MYANKCDNFNEIDSMKDTNYQSLQGGWLPEEPTMWLEG